MTPGASTSVVGLMGWPVAHSFSPAMHNAAFAAAGLDWCYVGLPVPPDRVGAAVRGLPALGLRGANVTVPHKEAVLPHLDRATEAARRIGAANTLWVDERGQVWGDNTDAAGLVEDLRAHGVDPAAHDAVVLGAGGSARAAVVGLAHAGCRSILVLNRTPARARSLVAALRAHLPDTALQAGPLDVARAADRSLVVHCTRAGMDGDTTAWDPCVPLGPEHIVVDLVYGRPTPLLAHARAGGAQAIDGLGTLLHQGALSFTRWTGVPAPLDAMRAALRS